MGKRDEHRSTIHDMIDEVDSLRYDLSWGHIRYLAYRSIRAVHNGYRLATYDFPCNHSVDHGRLVRLAMASYGIAMTPIVMYREKKLDLAYRYKGCRTPMQFYRRYRCLRRYYIEDVYGLHDDIDCDMDDDTYDDDPYDDQPE